ncbi:MAG TPA: hypothetical protein VFZ53_16080 [Polyangiaceae bacterium]
MSIKARSFASIASLCTLFLSSHAGAFELVYGATPEIDSGARGVTPVQFCPGGGFVSAGTRQTAAASDVYVVRTSLAGFTVFERRYDVGPGSIDRGSSIVELRNGSGFVVVGTSAVPGGTDDVLLIRTDCLGNPVFTVTYGSPLRDSATDVIESVSGNAAFGTAAGDLVISGTTTHPAGNNTDGLLLRVRSNGALIWHRRYDVNSVNEAFASLTEARPSLGSPTGDIVAVGNWRSGAAPDQGYVTRVSGDTGAIGGGNTCAAIYGGPDTDRFTGVVESRVGATAGQLLFTGSSFSAAQANDIYLVRSQPNPCFSLAQRRIGAPAAAALGDESPSDIKQLTAAMGIGPTGALVLTGSVGATGTNAFDALLLSADITTLIPITGRRYGDHAGRRDQGLSLFQVPAAFGSGIVISGTADSDPQGVGDARDLYLVRTDVNGNTSCNAGIAMPHTAVLFPPTALAPLSAPILTAVQRAVAAPSQNTRYQSCP